jgi:hypothetical protein
LAEAEAEAARGRIRDHDPGGLASATQDQVRGLVDRETGFPRRRRFHAIDPRIKHHLGARTGRDGGLDWGADGLAGVGVIVRLCAVVADVEKTRRGRGVWRGIYREVCDSQQQHGTQGGVEHGKLRIVC